MKVRKWLLGGGLGVSAIALGIACGVGGTGSTQHATFTNPGPTCTGGLSPGFYCQEHPGLSDDELMTLAGEAAQLLSSIPQLDTADEILLAVCGETSSPLACDNPQNQLLRHLATTALNLAANLIDETSPLSSGSFATVGDLFDAAIAAALNNTSSTEDKAECSALSDALDATFDEGSNVVLGDECGEAPDAGVPDAAPPSPDAQPPSPDAAPPSPDAAPPSPDAAPPSPDAAPPSPDAGEQPPPQPED